jgi:aspartate/methionine/tyrosine aminotransferase
MSPAPIARRMAEIQPFHVMALLGRARELEAQGRSIVHMEIGEPDFPTPAPVVEAGRRALAEGRTHYTPSLGLPELREAIARHYRERFDVEVPARRIVVTTGGSGALLLALAALVNGGDRVLVSDPGYPCNRHFVRLLEGEPVGIPVTAADGFQLQAAHVAAHWDERTVAAMVATPSNPTGTLLTEPELRALMEAVHARGGRLVVDEIYQGLTYDQPPSTALTLSDELFIINSFSKYFCMTGWRLGWMVVPESFVDPVERLAQNLYLAAPTVAQHAALAAFEPESIAILEGYRAEFRRRRDYLLPALERLGFRVTAVPRGAFYIYADCSAVAEESFEFSRRLLEEAGVAVTPGNDFGAHGAGRHLRFAYTTGLEQLAEGIERIGKLLAA